MIHGGDHIMHIALGEADGIMEKFHLANPSDEISDLHSAITAMFLAGADFALRFAAAHPNEAAVLLEYMQGKKEIEPGEAAEAREDFEKILYGCEPGPVN